MTKTSRNRKRKRTCDRGYAVEKHQEIIKDFDELNKSFGIHAPHVSQTHKYSIIAEKHKLSVMQIRRVICV